MPGEGVYIHFDVESDSLAVINLIRHGCPISDACYALIQKIHEFRRLEGNFDWSHTFREGKKVADKVSKTMVIRLRIN